MSKATQTDDFNAYTLNQAPPSPWLSTPSTGGAVEVVADPAAGGGQGRVVRIFDNDSGSRSDLRWAFADPGDSSTWFGTVALEFKIRAAQTDKGLLIGVRENTGGGQTDRFLISMRNDGTFGYHSSIGSESSTSISGTTYSADTWYTIAFFYDRTDRTKWGNDNLIGFWMDGTKKGTTFNAGSNSWNFDQIIFKTLQSDVAATFYVDDIKYGGVYSVATQQLARQVSGAIGALGPLWIFRQSDGALLGTGRTNIAGFGAPAVIATETFSPTPCTLLSMGAGLNDRGAAISHIQVE